MARRIPPQTPEVARLERQAIDDLTELYPDKVVMGLDTRDEALGRRLEELCARMGYVSRRSMLEAWGFEYRGNPGGRPATVDAGAILHELERRYANRPKPATVTQLREENPDLVGVLKSLSNMSRKLFGQSLGKELEARGLVVKQPKGTGQVANRKKGPSITSEEVIDALDELRGRVESMPIEERPTTITNLYEAYPAYADAIRAGRKLKIVSTEMLRDLGILQPTAQQKKGMTIWKASVATLVKVYAACGGPELILPENRSDGGEYLRNGVIGLDVKNRWELRATTLVTAGTVDVAVGKEYDLVPNKADVSLYRSFRGGSQVSDFELMPARTYAYDDKQPRFVRRYYDTFITMDVTSYPDPIKAARATGRFVNEDPPDGSSLSTPLEAYAQPSAKVVSSENVGGRQVFRLQYRFLVPLSKETLLAALWKMGAVTADDLQGGLEWREWLQVQRCSNKARVR